MGLDIVRLHQMVDQWAAEQREESITTESVEPVRELPKDKRVVRTKTQGDKVFYLDEVKKTRQWIAGTQTGPTGPEILDSLGFSMGDVQEIADDELVKYQMGAAIYKIDAA